MTEKEKAKELVERYLKNIVGLAYAETKSKELAKQCALICLDEMYVYRLESLWRVGHSFSNDEITYLKEVKQEIEKL